MVFSPWPKILTLLRIYVCNKLQQSKAGSRFKHKAKSAFVKSKIIINMDRVFGFEITALSIKK